MSSSRPAPTAWLHRSAADGEPPSFLAECTHSDALNASVVACIQQTAVQGTERFGQAPTAEAR